MSVHVRWSMPISIDQCLCLLIHVHVHWSMSMSIDPCPCPLINAHVHWSMSMSIKYMISNNNIKEPGLLIICYTVCPRSLVLLSIVRILYKLGKTSWTHGILYTLKSTVWYIIFAAFKCMKVSAINRLFRVPGLKSDLNSSRIKCEQLSNKGTSCCA